MRIPFVVQRLYHRVIYRLPMTHYGTAQVRYSDHTDLVLTVWRTKFGGGTQSVRWYTLTERRDAITP